MAAVKVCFVSIFSFVLDIQYYKFFSVAVESIFIFSVLAD